MESDTRVMFVEKLQLLPAVDVQGGQAVQLVQGIAGTQKEFGDPLAAALRWQDGGAQCLHLVDLDAAFGRGSNAEVSHIPGPSACARPLGWMIG